MRDQKHNFALFYADLDPAIIRNHSLMISDQELIHRISKVLRLPVGADLTLFNQKYTILAQIKLIDKKSITVQVLNLVKQAEFKPKVVVALAVLKKENFENALYSCVELGASAILPILFSKSAPQKFNDERVHKILISAAEQSKNFNLPVWHAPISFEAFLAQIKSKASASTIYIYCDINGKPMLPFISQLAQQKATEIVLIIGPEGDLTTQEQQDLAKNQVLSMQLTPTVLRSFQAVTVALGAIRSLL